MNLKLSPMTMSLDPQLHNYLSMKKLPSPLLKVSYKDTMVLYLPMDKLAVEKLSL